MNATYAPLTSCCILRNSLHVSKEATNWIRRCSNGVQTRRITRSRSATITCWQNTARSLLAASDLRHMNRILLLPLVITATLSAFSQQERLLNVQVGQMAPEIVMANPSGDVLRLSELKGKLVLVDFWASWCRPCRMESPHVRRAYHTYKDRLFTKGDGFAVFSVSLDRQGQAEAWKAAIAKDSLDWKWHVGAVNEVQNAAAEEYGARFIPTNALVDGEGRIVAKDLHGEALTNALNALLEKDPMKLERHGKKAKR